MKKIKPEPFHFESIAIAHTPFKQRFGIPRQPGISPSAKGILKFHPNPDFVFALKRIEEFSHLWIIFVFHEHGGNKWKPTIRPPRLGGKEKAGVLSSRSPHRPNPIGMSAVKIDHVDLYAIDGPEIHVSGVDLLDGTPILDIKPYLPYTDSIPNANAGWAHQEIQKYPVHFSPESEKFLEQIQTQKPHLKGLIQELIEIDPRPAFQKRDLPVDQVTSEGLKFGIWIEGYDVQYEIRSRGFHILELVMSEKPLGTAKKSGENP